MKQLIVLFILICPGFVFSQSFEVRMMQRIHRDSTHFKDKSFLFLTKTVTPISIAAPSSLVLAGFINNDESIKRDGYRAAASMLLSTAVSVSFKYSIRRVRPFYKSPDLFCKKCKAGNLSFPSGHTTAAFATATSLTLASRKWYVAVPAYGWASGVAYSRMYLGVHYPSDILGGMVIGIGSSFLVWKLDQWMMKK